MKPLNLFYENPDPDRFFPLDRFPRRIVRRLIRGPALIGGQQRVFLNLCKGLDLLGVPYRINDYKYARAHPQEAVGIVGKPHVLDKFEWRNPILFGAAVFSHPFEDPDLLIRRPIKRILLPGEWMRQMWEPAYGKCPVSWPVGIDTTEWTPTTAITGKRPHKFLFYDKIRWKHEEHEVGLINPIRSALQRRGLPVLELRYGSYKESDFRALLDRCQAMIFLCEHETQGIAYQQALACGVPILAWERGGLCQDPLLYPDHVQFGPVSAVPYWDERCGIKFHDLNDFEAQLDKFLERLDGNGFAPREYILQNLTLEECSRRYVEHYQQVQASFEPLTW